METILLVLMYLAYALGPVAVIGIIVWISNPAKKNTKHRFNHMQNYSRSRVWNNNHLTEEAIREKYCK
jgi:hypothetical protein